MLPTLLGMRQARRDRTDAFTPLKLNYRFRPSGASHFSPKPTVKIERPVWVELCARVAAGAVLKVRGQVGYIFDKLTLNKPARLKKCRFAPFGLKTLMRCYGSIPTCTPLTTCRLEAINLQKFGLRCLKTRAADTSVASSPGSWFLPAPSWLFQT